MTTENSKTNSPTTVFEMEIVMPSLPYVIDYVIPSVNTKPGPVNGKISIPIEQMTDAQFEQFLVCWVQEMRSLREDKKNNRQAPTSMKREVGGEKTIDEKLEEILKKISNGSHFPPKQDPYPSPWQGNPGHPLYSKWVPQKADFDKELPLGRGLPPTLGGLNIQKAE